MTRKCSHCSHDGHNSRTCPRNNTANRGAGLRLFGVRLTDGSSSIRKCASMGNLTHISTATTSSNCAGGGLASAAATADGGASGGYASEDCARGPHSSVCRDQRKKGVPWTEEEHRMFLLGLQKLGKGDWRGIARNYVISRTPTQVASHAQKYFIRQTNSTRRKRRSSLFDLAHDESIDPKSEEHEDGVVEESQLHDGGCESMDSTNSNDADVVMASSSKPEEEGYGEGEVGDKSNNYPMLFPTYFPPFFSYPCPYTYPYPSPSPSWPPPESTKLPPDQEEIMHHEIIKPTAVRSKKKPINICELFGISKLSLKDSSSVVEGSTTVPEFSLRLQGDESDRQSAFHANPNPTISAMDSTSTSTVGTHL